MKKLFFDYITTSIPFLQIGKHSAKTEIKYSKSTFDIIS